MSQVRITKPARRELKIRIHESLYERLVAECGECGCSLNAVVTLGIAREVNRRREERQRNAQAAILAGQIAMELEQNA